MRYAIGCKLDRLIYIAIGFGVRMNASRWGCPINLTLDARSTSRRSFAYRSGAAPLLPSVRGAVHTWMRFSSSSPHISSSGAHGRPADRRAPQARTVVGEETCVVRTQLEIGLPGRHRCSMLKFARTLLLPNALVQLQAHYHHCGEAASEKCLSAATFVRPRRRQSRDRGLALRKITKSPRRVPKG